ncbi:MAG: hypothetical protein JW723_04925 [Bacteroidales bacterium]|nr:hypothetical protein [Bacteroidales bacterium]
MFSILSVKNELVTAYSECLIQAEQDYGKITHTVPLFNIYRLSGVCVTYE